MPSAFGKFLDAVADLLGFSSGNTRQQQSQRPAQPATPHASRPEPPARPEGDGDSVPTPLDGTPIQPGGCHACGVRPASPSYENLFCSRECQRRWNFEMEEYRAERERRLADAMDACHDRMEELHGDD